MTYRQREAHQCIKRGIINTGAGEAAFKSSLLIAPQLQRYEYKPPRTRDTSVPGILIKNYEPFNGEDDETFASVERATQFRSFFFFFFFFLSPFSFSPERVHRELLQQSSSSIQDPHTHRIRKTRGFRNSLDIQQFYLLPPTNLANTLLHYSGFHRVIPIGEDGGRLVVCLSGEGEVVYWKRVGQKKFTKGISYAREQKLIPTIRKHDSFFATR